MARVSLFFAMFFKLVRTMILIKQSIVTHF